MEHIYLDAGSTWPPDAEMPASDPRAFLVAAAKHANFCIRQFAELNPEHRGMGAAVVPVHVGGSGFCLAHVGHVRGYRCRDDARESKRSSSKATHRSSASRPNVRRSLGRHAESRPLCQCE